MSVDDNYVTYEESGPQTERSDGFGDVVDRVLIAAAVAVPVLGLAVFVTSVAAKIVSPYLPNLTK